MTGTATKFTSISVLWATPGNYSVLVSAVAILDGARYQNVDMPTAILDKLA